MNDFASTVSAALHQEAQEISMSIDMQQAERQLRETMRIANRRRRLWAVAAAAAMLLVVAGVITFALNRPGTDAGPITPAPSSTPSPVTFALDGSGLVPGLTAQLPRWVATAEAVATGPDGYTYGQTICGKPSGLCPDSPDRTIQILNVRHMYPLDGAKNISPTYAQLVTAWKDVQRLGYGTVTDVTTTTVGGRPATTMTVAGTRQMDGLASCGLATDAQHASGCYGLVPGLTLNLAIVDRGAGQPPTVLWESHTTVNAQQNGAVATEFATWLGTVQFP